MQNLPKIWFLRHGETHWNKARRIQGQLESDLTETGLSHARAQARLLAPVLASRPDCFVSPLGRAQQTAKIALGDTPYLTDNRLAEAHAGDWQGLLRADVIRDFPDLTRPGMRALELFLAAPGGEGYAAFEARILDFLGELTGPSVIVAHGLLGQVMRGIILGLDRQEMGQLANRQGCVYVLEDGTEIIMQ
ncbi:Glucosyl-3-phosphoglycerate phosphatase [Roseovarius litorisediminis]|uniref:Glucosyl-3-phosphoglycerate phosphatase n=1 Tax=Roseovarius litorisediminis TaxID=1312363 RepID=A0A1Y5TDD5_9RHOB|nr:histidine phosphatase family protein [Roseovarius litorisediminis]SLN61420.1 Glucosyl-3-phosphoglycerate phosphatase [Roseovarius litorisediminis]